jgi:hypothetical protein
MPNQMQRWIDTVKGWMGMATPKPSSSGGKTGSTGASNTKQGKK